MSKDPPRPSVLHYDRSFVSFAVKGSRQMEALNASDKLPVNFRSVAGTQSSFLFEAGQSQSLSVWRANGQGGFIAVPKVHLDLVSIRFLTEGSILRREHRRDLTGHCGQAMLLTFEDMRQEEAATCFAAVSGTVTRAALAAGHRALVGHDESTPFPCFSPVVNVAGLPLQALRQTVERIFVQLKDGVPETDLNFPLLQEMVIYQLLTAWPRRNAHDPTTESMPPLRRLRHAKDYIDDNLARKMQLADVAEAAGIGVRRLQLLFRMEIGKTPIQYILERRLDRAHADLLSPSEQGFPVNVIAARWGFAHMGDFSRRYRERFGEAPGLTRQRPASERPSRSC